MARAPLKELTVYLGVSQHTVSTTLVQEEYWVQYPVHYVSHRLLDTKMRYNPIEKLAYSLVVASRKLRPYFQAHRIGVLTKYPLKQILQKPDSSGHLLKWSIELTQFDIEYKPRFAVKRQVLTDFITEFTRPIGKEPSSFGIQTWELYVDGSSYEHGARAGVLLISLEGHKIPYTLRFGFKATNNEAEYKALLLRLQLVKEVRA